MMDPIRKRRFSRDLSMLSGNNSSSSLQVPTPNPTISLQAAGIARLIFQGHSCSFEGVMITDDGDETYYIKGNSCKTDWNEKRMDGSLMDVSITDGETGQLFIIRRIELYPPPRVIKEEDENGEIGKEKTCKTLSAPLSMKTLKADAELLLGVQSEESQSIIQESQEVPRYELRSDALKFTTDDILVGNRADKEIRGFLSPGLAGRLLNVHMGRMKVEFSTDITPPPTPVFESRRRRGSCQTTSSNNANTTDGASFTATDADVNFLM